VQNTKAQEGQPTSMVVLMDTRTGLETTLKPGGPYPLTATTNTMKVYPPLTVVVENDKGIKQTTKYIAGNAVSHFKLDSSYKFTKITLTNS